MSTETLVARKIKIVPTKGESKTIETSASTWGQLSDQIGNSYDLSKMKAVESTKKHTLEHKDALLPEGDFKLFLMPYESKSGAKATPKKAAAKKAAPKKAAKAEPAAKKVSTKKAKAISSVVESVAAVALPEQTEEELQKEARELAGGFTESAGKLKRF